MPKVAKKRDVADAAPHKKPQVCVWFAEEGGATLSSSGHPGSPPKHRVRRMRALSEAECERRRKKFNNFRKWTGGWRIIWSTPSRRRTKVVKLGKLVSKAYEQGGEEVKPKQLVIGSVRVRIVYFDGLMKVYKSTTTPTRATPQSSRSASLCQRRGKNRRGGDASNRSSLSSSGRTRTATICPGSGQGLKILPKALEIAQETNNAT